VTTTVLAYIPSPSEGVLGHLGPLSALVIIFGVIAALSVGDWLREARDRERGGISDVALWAVPLGLIGVTLALAYFAGPVQQVWRLGALPIRWYAVWIVIGIIVAVIIGDRRWAARGGERGVIYDIALWAVPFGLIGGRLYHVITDWDKYFPDGAGIVGVLRIWDGGLGIWGAVALGGVGAWIGCRSRGIPLPAFGDAIAPGIVLAQAIGRLGNYYNQELYGRPTTLPWGLEIYQRRDASGALSEHLVNGESTGQLVQVVHPTFLYELLWNVLVFAALIFIDRRFKIGHGRLFAMYVAGYCVGRFWIELMRSDAATHIAGIRINSFTATFVFIGAVVYIMVAPKGREDPATLKGKPRDAEEEEEDTSVEDFVKELTGVAAATTGVVAAAKVAGEAEDEDAKTAGDEQANEDQPKSEAAVEAEQLTADIAEAPFEDIAEAEEFAEAKEAAEEAEVSAEAEELGVDVAGVPADDIAEAEEFAAEGEEEPEAESEAAAEAEQLAEDVEEAPSEDIGEAEEFAAAGEEAEPVGGVGAVEGEEAVEAEEAAPEAHEAAVEAAEEAEEVAAEVADAAADETEESEAAEEEAEPDESKTDDAEGAVDEAAVEEAEAEPSEEEAVAEPSEEEVEPVGGVGAVEGEEAVEAEEAAREAHEAAVEAAEKAEEVAAEVADAAADEEPAPEAESEVPEEAEPEPAEAEAVAEADGETAEAPSAESEPQEAEEPEVESEEPSEVAAEPEATVDDEAETAEVAAELEDLETEVETEEPETEDAEAAVDDAEAEPSDEEAAEEAEAVIDEAEAAEEEPRAEVLESEPAPETEVLAEEPEPDQAEESGGRLRRWFRGRRNR
jgi:prolipoprotein diacylglyceryl transferase